MDAAIAALGGAPPQSQTWRRACAGHPAVHSRPLWPPSPPWGVGWYPGGGPPPSDAPRRVVGPLARCGPPKNIEDRACQPVPCRAMLTRERIRCTRCDRRASPTPCAVRTRLSEVATGADGLPMTWCLRAGTDVGLDPLPVQPRRGGSWPGLARRLPRVPSVPPAHTLPTWMGMCGAPGRITWSSGPNHRIRLEPAPVFGLHVVTPSGSRAAERPRTEEQRP